VPRGTGIPGLPAGRIFTVGQDPPG
jgi:hypothetical protein